MIDYMRLPEFVVGRFGASAIVPLRVPTGSTYYVKYPWSVIPDRGDQLLFCRTRTAARKLALMCNGRYGKAKR